MKPRDLRLVAGGSLLCLALLVNPWLVERVAAADQQITSQFVVLLIVICQLLFFSSGLALVTGRTIFRWLAIGACLSLVGLAAIKAERIRQVLTPVRSDPTISSNLRILGRALTVDRQQRAILDRETSPTLHRLHQPTMRLTTVVPEGGMLDSAVGVDPVLGEFFTGAISFEIRVSGDDVETQRLFRTAIDLSDPAADVFEWRRVTVDLTQFEGSEVVLEFRKSASEEGSREIFDLAPTDLAYWGRPMIRPSRLDDRKNLVLISVDSLRSDHLGFMGYERETSPNLDALASQSVAFMNCFSQAPWTTPSHLSIFTSTYPSFHRGKGPVWDLNQSWNEELPTMAGILRDAGYVTAAFAGSATVAATFGFSKGFDSYNENPTDEGTDVERITGKAIEWLEKNQHRSFFLFVHTFEAHSPFLDDHFVHREGIDRGDVEAMLIAGYDSDVRRTDKHLGELLHALDRLSLKDNTLVVVTSDHGEELTEGRAHNQVKALWRHGHSLYDEILRVPLLLAGFEPAKAGLEIPVQVRSIDILPTVLDYLDVPAPAVLVGQSLRPLMDGTEEDRPVYSEATTYGPELESIRVDGYKLIHRISYGNLFHETSGGMVLTPKFELYDLEADPEERNNLADERPEKVAELLGFIETMVGENRSLQTVSKQQPQPPEVVESLRALGYID
jgi:arylsulfatase A-like enzyme